MYSMFLKVQPRSVNPIYTVGLLYNFTILQIVVDKNILYGMTNLGLIETYLLSMNQDSKLPPVQCQKLVVNTLSML